MQKTYSFLQVLAGLIAASLAIGALTIWTGVPVETAVRLRNMAFAIVGGFAIPCLALWLAARLGVGRSKPLIFYAVSRQILIGVFVVFAGFMAAGILAYPYAPIVMRDGEFRDKKGQTYTFLQYERFVRWESSFALVGASMLTGVLVSLPGNLGKRPNRAT